MGGRSGAEARALFRLPPPRPPPPALLLLLLLAAPPPPSAGGSIASPVRVGVLMMVSVGLDQRSAYTNGTKGVDRSERFRWPCGGVVAFID